MPYGQRTFTGGATLSTGSLLSIPLVDDADVHYANPVLRVAHLSDIHLRAEFDAPKRLRALFRHIRLTNPDINIWLNSGDTIFAPRRKTTLEMREKHWKIWSEIVEDELAHITVHSCLGPHDYDVSANDTASPASKNFAEKQLGNDAGCCRGFNRNGWHFCILDGKNDTGKLTDAQLAWLDADLEYHRDFPVLILSHHPLVAFCGVISSGVIHPHPNWRELILLFNTHPNVNLCLAGHTHLLDRVWYNGVKYCCNGSASGHWWEEGDDGKSACRQTPPGYAIIDLYANGTSRCEYMPFPERPHSENAF